MIDETNNEETWAATASQTTAQPTGTPETPSGFCQDCGKPLMAGDARRVGAAVFCDPCLARRTAVPPPPVNAAPGVMNAGAPNPTVAGFLGLIPGVGAMYNGQVAKGFAHIIIFAILDSFANHVSGVFGLLVCGWIAYQVFDAVHTARARRDGLPLPNFFNLNNIGEHFQHTVQNPPHAGGWPQGTPVATPPVTPADTAQAASTGWATVPPPVPPVYASAHPSQQANWAGYIPPTAFGGTAPYSPPQQPYAAPYQATPYPPMPAPAIVPMDTPPNHHFPLLAVVLIGLGAFFLAVNVIPSFHMSASWVSAVVLFGATAYSLVRRVGLAERMRSMQGTDSPYAMFHLFRIPLMLGMLAVLFTLQAAGVSTIAQTWPLLLIVGGIILFADRAMQPRDVPVAVWPVPPVAPPVAPAVEDRHE